MSKDNQKPEAPIRGLKKSETLEVRMPYETKQAFLTACRDDGTTASEVVREKVQSYLEERVRPVQQPERPNIVQFAQKLSPTVRRYGPRVAASGIAAIALTTFAVLPSAAAPDFQAAFKKLDVNGDGVITAEEFAGKSGGKDGDVVVSTTTIRRASKDGDTAPRPAPGAETKQEAFSFWLPNELGDQQQQHEYRVLTSRGSHPADDEVAGSAPMVISIEGIRKKEFEGFDTDKDGKVSFKEFQDRQKAMLTRGFEMLDADHDKFLSQAEYNTIASPPIRQIAAMRGDIPARIQIDAGGPRISDEALTATFAKLDANKDRKLSLEEYLPPV